MKYRPCDVLTHRDFLGSFLAAGITRSAMGDILVGEGRSVLFVKDEVSGFLIEQISKIGRVGVRLSRGAEEPDVYKRQGGGCGSLRQSRI